LHMTSQMTPWPFARWAFIQALYLSVPLRAFVR
jgi:hypothetical protein